MLVTTPVHALTFSILILTRQCRRNKVVGQIEWQSSSKWIHKLTYHTTMKHKRTASSPRTKFLVLAREILTTTGHNSLKQHYCLFFLIIHSIPALLSGLDHSLSFVTCAQYVLLSYATYRRRQDNSSVAAQPAMQCVNILLLTGETYFP